MLIGVDVGTGTTNVSFVPYIYLHGSPTKVFVKEDLKAMVTRHDFYGKSIFWPGKNTLFNVRVGFATDMGEIRSRDSYLKVLLASHL